MIPVAPVTLADAVVRLEPLSRDHEPALVRAASIDRSTYSLTRVPNGADEVRAYVARALDEQARGLSIPFATCDAASGRVVGTTRFMAVERWTWHTPGHPEQRDSAFLDAVEIGSTWLAKDAQRTAINTHAKLLMLTHAFEAWAARRVTLKTDARNRRSRNAIERIGAKLDGVLRAHMPAFDGGVRDTAFFSIVASEWPEVKRRLVARTRLAVRRATRADAPALVAFVNAAYRGDSARAGWTNEADLVGGARTGDAEMRAMIDDANGAVLVHEQGGAIVACVHVEKTSGGDAYLGMLTVKPELQASGIGKRLLASAEAFVRDAWNVAAIEMTVIAAREELLAWYERRGYARTGERRPFRPEMVALREDLHFVVMRKTTGAAGE